MFSKQETNFGTFSYLQEKHFRWICTKHCESHDSIQMQCTCLEVCWILYSTFCLQDCAAHLYQLLE